MSAADESGARGSDSADQTGPAESTGGVGESAGEVRERTTCTPCRGTGQLSSGLGGQPHQVTCPWCGGSGQFGAGRDAQEHPAEQG